MKDLRFRLAALCALALTAQHWLGCGADVGGSKVDEGNGNGNGKSASGGSSSGNSGKGGTIGIADSAPGPGDTDGCKPLTVQYGEVTPTILLLIDRSSSMWDLKYGTSPDDRWTAMSNALVGSGSIVQELAPKVRFGLATYTGQLGGTCPLLNQAAIGLNNFAGIKTEFDKASIDPKNDPSSTNRNKGETPTGASVIEATKTLEAFTEPGPKYILLATDGEPDTCPMPDPQCGQDQSVAAVQAARVKGIGTIVIGLGEVGESHLRDLANAGAGLPVQRPIAAPPNCDPNTYLATLTGTYQTVGGNGNFYRPLDPAALKDDIRKIIGGVRECSVELKGIVDLTRANQCDVKLNGAGLTYQDPDGWSLTNGSQLATAGRACAAIQNDQMAKLEIVCPCGVVDVPR